MINQSLQAKDSLVNNRFALWDIGFRPFYLLASLFGIFSILLWAAQLSGYFPYAYLYGSVWHGHEMLFGYTTAVITGFLLTAVRVWTKEATPSGTTLMALAALWICGRVLVLTPFAMTAAVINAAFPISVALAISIPLVRSQNFRNYFFVGLLLLMGLLIFIVHLALQGYFSVLPSLLLQLALDIVLLIMAVIGGRIIPIFTNNGVPGANATCNTIVDKFSLGTIILLFVADLLQASQHFIFIIVLTSLIAHGIRWLLWKPWQTIKVPLVWILHVAYAWLVVHFLLRGLSALELLVISYSIHALTVGAIGGLTLGMMVRTARGHTGRPLITDKFEVTMFVLIQVGALIRVFGGIVSQELYMASIQISSLLWVSAFSLFVFRYWSVLIRPRIDGKPL